MSAPNIVQLSSDKAISIVNGAIARRLSLPANWVTVRVGWRGGFCTGPGNAATGTPHHAFGLCEGTDAIFGDATVTGFLGAYSDDDPTWANDSNLYLGGTHIYGATKAGSAITKSGSHSLLASMAIQQANGTNKETIQFVDINRNITTSSRITVLQVTSENGQVFSNAKFIADMQTAGTPGGYGAGAQIAVNHASGLCGRLNAVNFYWSNASIPWYIKDLAVAVIA